MNDGVRRCSVCGEMRPLVEFLYRKKRRVWDTWCQECRRVKSRAWHHANRDKSCAMMQRYARGRYWADPDAARARSRAMYAADPAAKKRYETTISPQARRTYAVVKRALVAGRINRPDRCARCSKACKPEAHHADHGKPFEIEWLCSRCHGLTRRVAYNATTQPPPANWFNPASPFTMEVA